MNPQINIHPLLTIIAFTLILFILLTNCKKGKQEETIDCRNSIPGYQLDIKPIINPNCLSSGCHNVGSNNGDFTTYDGLKVVALSGALEKRVVADKTMPPSAPLFWGDRKKIKCWIESGAPNN